MSNAYVDCIQKAFESVDPEVLSKIFTSYLETTRSQMLVDQLAMNDIDAEHRALQDELIHKNSVIKDLRSIIKTRNKRIDELYAKAGEHRDRAQVITNVIITRLCDHPGNKAWHAILDVHLSKVDALISAGEYGDAAEAVVQAVRAKPVSSNLSMAIDAVHARKDHLKHKLLPKKLRKFIKRHKNVTNLHYEGAEFWYVPHGGTDPAVSDDFPVLEEITSAEPGVWHEVKHPHRVGCAAGIGWYRKYTEEERKQYIPF